MQLDEMENILSVALTNNTQTLCTSFELGHQEPENCISVHWFWAKLVMKTLISAHESHKIKHDLNFWGCINFRTL